MRGLKNQVRGWRGGFVLCSLTVSVACGGGSKEPKSPADSSTIQEETTPESSLKVKQGREAIQAERFEEAESLLSEAVQESPEDAHAAFYYGVALEGVGKSAEAEAAYKKALGLDPKLTEASQNLSALLLDADEAEAALQVADAGLAHQPEASSLLVNRALALDSLASPEAVAAYEKALKKQPDEPWIRYNYAVVLAAQDRSADAKKQLSQVTLAEPQLAAAVAQLYGQLKDFSACVKVLDGALAKELTPELLIHRGVCKYSAGDEAGAGTDLKKAVELEPSSAAAHYYWGKHLLTVGQTASGRTHLNQAAELGQGTPIGDKARAALQQPTNAKK